MFPEARELAHLGIRTIPRCSTLSDANARRSELVFEDMYRSLYARYKSELSSDIKFTSAATNDSFMLKPTNYIVGDMEYRVQVVEFKKRTKDGDDIRHKARIVTYVDIRKTKPKIISLLTNDMDMDVEDIIAIYRKRWEIELLFK